MKTGSFNNVVFSISNVVYFIVYLSRVELYLNYFRVNRNENYYVHCALIKFYYHDVAEEASSTRRVVSSSLKSSRAASLFILEGYQKQLD